MHKNSKLLYRPKTAVEHVHHNRYATILLNNIGLAVKKTIDSFENLTLVDNKRETIALTTETNSFANDLQTFVQCNLTRIVIKTLKDGHFNQDVAQVAKNFSNYIYSIQKSWNTTIDDLKRELKRALEGVSVEVCKLFNLLQTEPTYRIELLIILDDVLFAVKKVYYRNILETEGQNYLKNTEVTLKKDFFAALNKLTNKNDDASVNHVIEYSQNAISHQTVIVSTLDEDADGYEGKIQLRLEQAGFNISTDLAILEVALRNKNEPSAIRDHLKLCGTTCCDEMVSLIGFDIPRSPNEKISVNYHNLILLLLAHHLAMGYQITEGLDHISIE